MLMLMSIAVGSDNLYSEDILNSPLCDHIRLAYLTYESRILIFFYCSI